MATMVSAVAESWLELRIVDELLAVTQRNVTLQEDALRLVQLRVRGGVAAGIDETRSASSFSLKRT